MILHQVGVFQYHLWLQNYLKMKYLSSMKKVCIHLRKMSQLFLYFTGIVSGLANFFLFRRSSPFVPFQTGDATVIFGRVKYEFAGTRTLCLAMKWFYVQMCVFGTNTWYSCKAWFLGMNTTFFLLPFRYFIKLNFDLTLTNSVKTYDISLVFYMSHWVITFFNFYRNRNISTSSAIFQCQDPATMMWRKPSATFSVLLAWMLLVAWTDLL